MCDSLLFLAGHTHTAFTLSLLVIRHTLSKFTLSLPPPFNLALFFYIHNHTTNHYQPLPPTNPYTHTTHHPRTPIHPSFPDTPQVKTPLHSVLLNSGVLLFLSLSPRSPTFSVSSPPLSPCSPNLRLRKKGQSILFPFLCYVDVLWDMLCARMEKARIGRE